MRVPLQHERPGQSEATESELSVAVAVLNEMARRGLTAMLMSLSQVGMAYPFDDLAAALRCVRDGRTHVLILSCADELETEQRRQANRELAAQAADAGVKILYLLNTADQAGVAQATTLPADGFLLQSELTAEALDDALTRLVQGEIPIPSTLARGLISRARTHHLDNRPRPVLLTPREHQALSLLAEGLSNKQIARRLGISEHGAKRHVANVLAKMNCPNRTLAVAMALRDGLLPEPGRP